MVGCVLGVVWYVLGVVWYVLDVVWYILGVDWYVLGVVLLFVLQQSHWVWYFVDFAFSVSALSSVAIIT